MFGPDSAPRPQRGPSRPNSPGYRPRPLKTKSSVTQSSSTGWSWPRLVSVEVDIEESRRKDSHVAPVDSRAEQPVNEGRAEGNSADAFTNRNGTSPLDIRAQTTRSEKRNSASPIDRDLPEQRSSPTHEPDDSSRLKQPGLRSPSPAYSDGSLRNGGAVTAEEYPISEAAHSPALSVRRLRTGSPIPPKRTQEIEADNKHEPAELESKSEDPEVSSLPSDGVSSNEPSVKYFQSPRTTEPATKMDFKRPRTDDDSEQSSEPEIDRVHNTSSRAKSSSVSANAGRPPGSFPGSDDLYDVSSPSLEELGITEPASAFGAPERKQVKEDPDTENESSEPHVTFKGDKPSQLESNIPTVSTYLGHDQSGNNYQSLTNTESPLAKPLDSVTVHDSALPAASASLAGGESRRPSRESLRTKARKPSFYIPLSRVAEAKGKIESANVQPPQTGIIVNSSDATSPDEYRKSKEPSSLKKLDETKEISNREEPKEVKQISGLAGSKEAKEIQSLDEPREAQETPSLAESKEAKEISSPNEFKKAKEILNLDEPREAKETPSLAESREAKEISSPNEFKKAKEILNLDEPREAKEIPILVEPKVSPKEPKKSSSPDEPEKVEEISSPEESREAKEILSPVELKESKEISSPDVFKKTRKLSSPEASGKTDSPLALAHGTPKATFLDYGNRLQGQSATRADPDPKPLASHDNSTETVPTPVAEPRMSSDSGVGMDPVSTAKGPTLQENTAEIAPVLTERGGEKEAWDEQSIGTPSRPSSPSEELLRSEADTSARGPRTPEDVINRISIPDELKVAPPASKRRSSTRQSAKMSLPPPRITIQSPSSASDVPEPLNTPAVPIPVNEYKVKSRSGTVTSVEHTVHGPSDKLAQSAPRKRKLYLHKARNLAARKVVLNATLGRQMGERTKKRLRQLAKGEQLAKAEIPAQESAPDLPPLRGRKSFIRKARNIAARQAILDATLGRQVAAETKPVLRRMANGEMVVVEETDRLM